MSNRSAPLPDADFDFSTAVLAPEKIVIGATVDGANLDFLAVPYPTPGANGPGRERMLRAEYLVRKKAIRRLKFNYRLLKLG